MIAEVLEGEAREHFLKLREASGKTLGEYDIVIGAADGDTACGILAADAVEKGVLSIRYIFVEPRFRRRGAGRMLIRELLDTAQALGARRIACAHYVGEESDGIWELLDEAGFSPEPEAAVPVYAASLDALKTGKTHSFDTIRPLKEADIPERDCDRDLSCLLTDPSGKKIGELIVLRKGEDLILDRLSVNAPDPGEGLLTLIGYGLEKAKKKYPGETRIYAEIPEKKGQAALQKLSGGRASKAGEYRLQLLEDISGALLEDEEPVEYYGTGRYLSDVYGGEEL